MDPLIRRFGGSHFPFRIRLLPPQQKLADIQGKFRFTGDNDTLSVVFRSDLTVTNQGERRGVQAALQEGATLTNPSGSLLYHHADATNWPTLFYRAVTP